MRAAAGITLLICLLLMQSCAGLKNVKKTEAGTSAVAAQNLTNTAGVKTADTTAATTAADKKQPVKNKFSVKQMIVNSDTMNYNKDTSEAVFRGNVETQASDVLIKSDMLTSRDYKQNAKATGNVVAYYKAQGVTIECGTLDYKNQLSLVYAYDGVTAHKSLNNGDSIVLKAERLVFNAAENTLSGKKKKKRIRITMKDIIAFCDEVSYNDNTKELLMTGLPLVKKSKSVMLADSIMMDVEKQSMKLKNNIWTKMFYKDFEAPPKEAKIEANKNTAPGKDVQQKAGSK